MGALRDGGAVHRTPDQSKTVVRNEQETPRVYETHVANREISKFYRQRYANQTFFISEKYRKPPSRAACSLMPWFLPAGKRLGSLCRPLPPLQSSGFETVGDSQAPDHLRA